MILLIQKDGDKSQLFSGDYFKTVPGMAITTGILLALTMFFNVWLVIWPNQKKVIANARNVQAGGEADPNAAAAGSQGVARLAHEHDLLVHHVAVHGRHRALLPARAVQVRPSGSDRGLYWAIVVVIWLVLELNALGVIGGTKPGGLNMIFDTHKAAIATGAVARGRVLRVFYLVLKA